VHVTIALLEPEEVFALWWLFAKDKRRRTRNRRVWMHLMLSTLLTMGAFHTLFNDLREDDGKFFSYFRMSPRSFYELYSKLKDHLHKRDTNTRRCIPAKERLAVTLRYVDYSPYIIFKCLSVMLFRPFYMELRSERRNMNKYSPIMSVKSIKQKNTLLPLSVTLLLDTSKQS
jgi:hypothetical protein